MLIRLYWRTCALLCADSDDDSDDESDDDDAADDEVGGGGGGSAATAAAVRGSSSQLGFHCSAELYQGLLIPAWMPQRAEQKAAVLVWFAT